MTSLRANASGSRPGIHGERTVATPIENIDIAKVFEEVADLLEIQGANQFRVRAYRTAARSVETLGVPCASLARTDSKALLKAPHRGAGVDDTASTRRGVAGASLAISPIRDPGERFRSSSRNDRAIP